MVVATELKFGTFIFINKLYRCAKFQIYNHNRSELKKLANHKNRRERAKFCRQFFFQLYLWCQDLK